MTCTEPGAPCNDGRTWDKPADQNLSGTVDWILNTNCGRITVALDAQAAPKNVNALAFLTDQGYYSGNFCHRLTTAGIFVLQCGSPAPTGLARPDSLFRTRTSLMRAGNYPAGTVAMANRGPDTASSQVFLVYKKTTLPAGCTIVGKVSEGLDVVKLRCSRAWRRDHRMRPMDHRHNPS